jgi:hypothetical protein
MPDTALSAQISCATTLSLTSSQRTEANALL